MVKVTREVEWDDATRDRVLDLATREEGKCRCGCGLPMAIAHDPESRFAIEEYSCRAGRAIAQIQRERAEQNKDRPGWDDGLHFFARPYDPERDDKRRRRDELGRG